MARKNIYPLGIQTFEEIVSEGYLYVDKTEIVYDLVNSNKYVFLSRPRRFGKSLLISTIDAYFQGRKELFQGLAMESLEKDWEVHPVLRFDLSGESYQHAGKLVGKISHSLSRYEAIYGKDPEADSLADRFTSLIAAAEAKTKHKVVILIDEYDKPMIDNIHDDALVEDFRKELRGFYGTLKGNDAHIRFAMLTGVTKFAHVSVFSGLNNLRDISMNRDYNAICGISESEFHKYFANSIETFADANKWSVDMVWKAFKAKYDGYLFCDKGEGIYNPFSVLYAFADNKLGEYWFRSGTPTLLVNVLKKNNYNLSDIEGGEFTEMELSDLVDPDRDYHALFFQAGYLTVKGYIPASLDLITGEDTPEKYILGFPNREVSMGFWKSLYDNYLFADSPIAPFDEKGFVKAVETGDPQDFMTLLQSLLAELSYGNTPKDNIRLKEINFQNDLQIIFRMLGFKVKTEIAVASGRIDMTVETNSYVYLFEFKTDSTPEAAIKQIRDNVYAAKFASDSRRVFLIGATFSTKTNSLSSFLIE